MLDRSRSRDRSKAGGAFSPAGLFVSGAQGAWYDPSDYSTLFQNSTGTTPVTAVEQPVRLMLDRSRGLVRADDLRSGGSIGLIGSATAATYNFSTGVGSVSRAADVNNQSFVSWSGLTVSAYYMDIEATGAASLMIRSGSSTGSQWVAVASGARTTIVIPPNSGSISITAQVNATTAPFTLYAFRELPGNHATAPNDASRPVLRSRYNLLTYSEQFDNAAWGKADVTVTANSIAAPDGTTTADSMVENTANAIHRVQFSITAAATSHTSSVYVKALGSARRLLINTNAMTGASALFDLTGSGSVVATFGVSYASSTITALANGWYRCSVTGTGTAVPAAVFFQICRSTHAVASDDTYTGDGTSGFYLWGAQLLTAADQTSTGGAYQRIAAATDYDVSNPVWRPYLAFDGSDDHMVLASAINITTDMTVVRGFGRSAAAVSSRGLGVNGATSPRDAALNTSNEMQLALGASLRTIATGRTDSGSLVVTSIRNSTIESASINREAPITVAAGSITGAFSALGVNNTFFNNGPIYGLILLDRELTGSELTATEQWMAGKTGATLA